MNIIRSQIKNTYFGNPQCIAERILFIKRANRLDEYKARLSNIHEFGNVWQGITGLFYGQQLTIIAAGIGPSMIGDAIYALDHPGSICLYAGTCGGLQEELAIGDYFIADHAICGDGYSFHFGHAPLAETSGDSSIVNSLNSIIHAKTYRVYQGTSFTTSSVVREADSDFWKTVDKKCGVIEMAASAFYAAASASQKKAAAYFWVTDLPTRNKSFFDTLNAEDIQTKQDRYEKAINFDLDLLTSI